MTRLKELLRKLRKVNRRRRKKTRKGKRHDRLDRKRKQLLERIERKRKWLEDHADPQPNADGTADWRGMKVVAWMVGAAPGRDGKKVNWLQKSVERGWDGRLSSAYRSPEYSESLCRNMCGAPSCPGRCAGRASNHSGSAYPGGAIDVYPEYAQFEAIQKQIGSPLQNQLDDRDPVHFSVSGR